MSNDIEQKAKDLISHSLSDYKFQFDVSHDGKTYPVFVKSIEILENGKVHSEYTSTFEDKEKLDQIVVDVIQQIIKKKVATEENNKCRNTLSKRSYQIYYTTKNIFATSSRLWSLIIFPIMALRLFLN